jgi:hypothetical protein
VAKRIASAVAAVLCLAACGSVHHRIPASWRAVDACLEQRPAYVGKVRADDSGGPGGRGSLVMVVSDRRFVQAYRFPTRSAAVAGVGPPGTVTYYGSVAVLVSSESKAEVAYIKSCFARVYG